MGERGRSLPNSLVQPLIYVEFNTGDRKGISVTIHGFATQIPHTHSSSRPKNVCQVFILKNNDGPTLSRS